MIDNAGMPKGLDVGACCLINLMHSLRTLAIGRTYDQCSDWFIPSERPSVTEGFTQILETVDD